jgi:transcriptional regulator with XRE-family HTH domain
MVSTYSDLTKQEHIDLIIRWIDRLEGGYITAFTNKIGISRATVSMWRTGKQGPGKDTIQLILKNYKLTPEQYYAGPEKYSICTVTTVRGHKQFSLPGDLTDKIEELAVEYGLSSGNELVTCLCQMFALFDDGSRRAFLARWMEWRLQGLDKKPDPPLEDSIPEQSTTFHARLSLANQDKSDPEN